VNSNDQDILGHDVVMVLKCCECQPWKRRDADALVDPLTLVPEWQGRLGKRREIFDPYMSSSLQPRGPLRTIWEDMAP
jgi:hypothetical protein